jgi:hypothetical protein
VNSIYLNDQQDDSLLNGLVYQQQQLPRTNLGQRKKMRLKGVAQFDEHAWIKIAPHFLSWRIHFQIRTHFRSQLDPHIKMKLDLLLRRTIIFGQNWSKVIEGIQGRTSEQCNPI